MDAMKEALKKRRGKGLTIEIILGGDVKDENKDPSLAPSGKPEMEDEAMKEPMESAEPSEKEAKEFDKEMAGDMSEEDMEMKPRSLGERARMFAAKRLKKY